MPTTIARRSTRMEVLELLRRKGHASAETISSDLGVTPNAVRQHLPNLERHGFVLSHPKRPPRPPSPPRAAPSPPTPPRSFPAPAFRRPTPPTAATPTAHLSFSDLPTLSPTNSGASP